MKQRSKQQKETPPPIQVTSFRSFPPPSSSVCFPINLITDQHVNSSLWWDPQTVHAMYPLWTHCQHSRESESLPASEKLAGSKGLFRLRGSVWFPEPRNLLIPGASEIKGRHSPSLPFFSLSLNLLSIQQPSKEALCWDWFFPAHRPAPALPGPKNVRAPWKESHCTKWVPDFYAHANKGSSRPKSIHTVLHQKQRVWLG